MRREGEGEDQAPAAAPNLVAFREEQEQGNWGSEEEEGGPGGLETGGGEAGSIEAGRVGGVEGEGRTEPVSEPLLASTKDKRGRGED